MTEAHEAELRIAVDKGFVSEEEVESLLERARGHACTPLELLHEDGLISEQTLAAIRQAVRAESGTGDRSLDEGLTLAPNSTHDGNAPGDVPFPVPGWDRYQGVRLLGQGGMGQVFLAYDPRLRRNVALKFVRGDDTELVRRLLSEARAQARVEHERVCQVYEVGEVQGRPFIAMQYIQGVLLDQLARELTLEQKVLLLRDAAEGVHAAHRAGLIHRDLKPSNILVERTEDGRLKPYVVDFGLAREWRARGATATGTALGTPHYMAPEQARGEVESLDRRADVYSLGATLYFLLMGTHAIPGSNGLEVLSNIAVVDPCPPRSLNPDFPADLEAIVLKCLEKDRSARYDSARALIEDLDRWLAGEPVQARATGRGYWLLKKAHKHRRLVAVAAAALLAVALSLGWAVYTRQQTSRREQLARRFTEKVERIEALARYSGLSRLHDTERDRKALQESMEALKREIGQAGALAAGPGHYALGRGALALGDDATARTHLEAAWQLGFREPRVAWSLALALGHLYQEQLLEAGRIRDPEERKARLDSVRRQYRAPVLDSLRQSQDSREAPPEYVEALIAFYEERLQDALAILDKLGEPPPWFYEAALLRGDILRARASALWDTGDSEGARAAFAAGRQAYADAADTGRSVLAIALAQAELEYSELMMEIYGQGQVLPPFERGREAVARARQIAPGRPESWFLEARLYRRLAEYRVDQGSPAEEPLQQALVAARKAVDLSPQSSVFRMELARCLWQWGRARERQGRDPLEQLREALSHLQHFGANEQDAGFHFQRGLIFGTWAQYEARVGTDPVPHLNEGIAAYEEASRGDERMLGAWFNLGILYLTRAEHSHGAGKDPEEDLKQARTALSRAQALNPRHIDTYYFAAQVNELEAQRHRARGEDARPDWHQALEQYQRGIAINRAMPRFLDQAGFALLELARESWDRGEDPSPFLEQARASFGEAIAAAPERGISRHNLSEVLLQQARYEHARGESSEASLRAAMSTVHEALKRLEGFPQPWANLGAAHALQAAFELGQGRDPTQSLARAEEALRTAYKLNPQFAQASRYLGESQALRARWKARRGQGRDEDFEQAARHFQKALELAPTSHDYRLAYGHFCHEWASWRARTGLDMEVPVTQGLALAEALVAARPGWPDARILRASLLLLRAEVSQGVEPLAWRRQAQEDLTQALAISPHFERSWKPRLLELRRSLGLPL
ncbi:protein kinase [Archangium violaceum]|uniref:protein kinase domain-containing protein n=1 Tax=Archangium violaceum TaxID=83451 RepID=UPI002B291084|nr:protein kinase [Archangium violaceum]